MKESKRLRDAFKYLFQDELDFLYSVSESLPDNPVIVNIGAGSGTSGLAFLEARPDSLVTTIDVTKDDSPFGSLTAEWISANIAGVDDRLAQKHGDSIAVGEAWDEPVDLVFVDGNHSYEGCIGDMRTWVNHIKPGGYLLVHDYDKEAVYERLGDYDRNLYPHPKPWPGVDLAVNEFKSDKRVEFVEAVSTMAVFRRVLSDDS